MTSNSIFVKDFKLSEVDGDWPSTMTCRLTQIQRRYTARGFVRMRMRLRLSRFSTLKAALTLVLRAYFCVQVKTPAPTPDAPPMRVHELSVNSKRCVQLATGHTLTTPPSGTSFNKYRDEVYRVLLRHIPALRGLPKLSDHYLAKIVSIGDTPARFAAIEMSHT